MRRFLAYLGAATATGFIIASAYANYIFIGYIGVLAVIANALCPFWIETANQLTLRAALRILWVIALTYSSMAALSYGTLTRQATAATQEASNANYHMELKALSELEAQRQSRTRDEALRTQRDKIAAMRTQGAMKTPEPHVTLLARISSLHEDTIRLVLMVLLGILIELGASITLFASLQNIKMPVVLQKVYVERPPPQYDTQH